MEKGGEIFSSLYSFLKYNVETVVESVSSNPVVSLSTPGKRSGIDDLL